MHATQSLWTLIDELGPSLPFAAEITWTVSLDTIMRWLNAHDLDVSEETVEKALASSAEWNPGWPWAVERLGRSFVFTPRLW
jgi:hypothetical protein